LSSIVRLLRKLVDNGVDVFLELRFLRIGQIILIGFRINQQQENWLGVIVVVINDAGTAALPFTGPREADLPQSSSTLDNPPGFGAPGQKLQQVVKASLAKQFPCLLLEGADRDQCLHQL